LSLLWFGIFWIKKFFNMNYSLRSLNNYPKDTNFKGPEKWKFFVLNFLFAISFVGLVFRLLYFQIFKYSDLSAKASNNYTNRQYILPNRGIIYDSKGGALVANKAQYVIALNLQSINRYKKYSSLEQVLNSEEIKILKKYKAVFQDEASAEKFNEDLGLGKEYFVFKDLNSDTEYYEYLSDVANIKSTNLVAKEEVYRNYVSPEEYSHILGYASSVSAEDLTSDSWYTPNSKIGIAGIEKSYETYLRGEKGILKKFEFSNSKTGNTEYITQKKDGYSLYTSLDPELQRVSYESLKQVIEDSNAIGGAVVVQKVMTGEILSLVSLPSYDNNSFSKGISTSEYTKYLEDKGLPLTNRAISSNYPPGSTFKLIVAYAGLIEGSLTVNDFITDVGVISVGNFNYKTWKAGGHGIINVVGAIKESSDTFFYILGGGHSNYPQIKPLGAWNIYKYAKLFGLGERTDVDLPNEVSGFVPNPDWKQQELLEPWYIGNTYHMSIGQGFVSATPIQTSIATCAIANGGFLYKPHIVSKVVDEASGETIFTNQVSVLNSTRFDSDALLVLKEGMVEASSPGGTAYPLFNFPIKIAGKTGTSEFGDNENKKTHAWFTAFAPADKPEIAVTVFVEEGGGGADISVPVAKKIFESYFKVE